MKGYTRVVMSIAVVTILSSMVLGQVSFQKFMQEGGSRDRFIKNGNNTVTDTRTGLMWADADNGADVTWQDAKQYCKSYRGGGYDDWCLPTIEELKTLFDRTRSIEVRCKGDMKGFRIHFAPSIKLSCEWVWAADIADSDAACLSFVDGSVDAHPRHRPESLRTLPVRLQMTSGPVPAAAENVSFRFVDNSNGTVSDLKTGLMWANHDNNDEIDWDRARQYCENYRGGGYNDWRLPTIPELRTLYREHYFNNVSCADGDGSRWTSRIIPLIKLSCTWVWSSKGDTSGPASFSFFNRLVAFRRAGHRRALPVRVERIPSRFVDNGDGTITDRETRLMWANRDNRSDIDWDSARQYCQRYSGGGYSDWRLPTISELKTLYDPDAPNEVDAPDRTSQVKLTPLIKLSQINIWSSQTRGPAAAYFHFHYGVVGSPLRTDMDQMRALPVRTAK